MLIFLDGGISFAILFSEEILSKNRNWTTQSHYFPCLVWQLQPASVLRVNLNYLPPDGLRTGFVQFLFFDKISSENKIAEEMPPLTKISMLLWLGYFEEK